MFTRLLAPAISVYPEPLAGFKGPTSKKKEGGEGKREGRFRSGERRKENERGLQRPQNLKAAYTPLCDIS